MVPEDRLTKQEYLKKCFLEDVRVVDQEKGYLSVPAFNLRMDPSILATGAELINEYFKDDSYDIVHGIPHSGNYLATAVAITSPKALRLHTSRKDQVIPSNWKDVYRREVRSFTTSNHGSDVFAGINLSFVRKGDRVLLVDDACAHGETGVALIKGLQERGVKVVGFAVLFDKVFQSGLERVAELGVKVFSCVRVKKIVNSQRLLLA